MVMSCFILFFVSQLQTICETSVRCEKHARATRVYWLFCIFYAASRDRFLVSCTSNHLVLEAVIMHETKGFSRKIGNKIIVRKNNRIAKRVY